MGMIPEIKCRRCGATFSSLRSRCPNCGTRRVTQSSRTPGTTPGTVRGTASYERAEANTKWQMIFGLILVVAVILAVIVMVSTSLNEADSSVGSKVTAPIATNNLPVIDAAPTPSPTPTPSLEKIEIQYFARVIDTDFTITLNEGSIELTAVPYPMTVQGVNFKWSCDAENKLTLTPSDDTQKCAVQLIEGSGSGSCKLTVSAFGVEKTITVYYRES